MIEFMDVVYLALVVILMLLIFALFAPKDCWPLKSNKEHFDTYMNHDIGAYEIYERDGYAGKKPKNVSEAGLWSKYSWRDKDRLGANVFDKMYEEWAQKQNYAPEDSEYAQRSVDSAGEKDAYLDMKFGNAGGDNLLAIYSYQDMQSLQPGTVFNGQVITLAQKNY